MNKNRERLVSFLLAFLMTLNFLPIQTIIALDDIVEPKDIFAYQESEEGIVITGFKDGMERKEITIPSFIE